MTYIVYFLFEGPTFVGTTNFKLILRKFVESEPEKKSLWLDRPPETRIVFYDEPGDFTVNLENFAYTGESMRFLEWISRLRPAHLIFEKFRYDAYKFDAIDSLTDSPRLTNIHLSFDADYGLVDKREIFVNFIERLHNQNITLHFASNDIDFHDSQSFKRTYEHILARFRYFDVYIYRYFGIVWNNVYKGLEKLVLRNYS